MVESSFPWGGTTPGSAGPYSDTQFARFWEIFANQVNRADASIISGSGNGTDLALDVQEDSPPSANIIVKQGSALVQGRIYDTDADVPLAVAANTDGSGFDRIDLVILEVDFTAQTIIVKMLAGTPAGSPSVPALTQTVSIYQVAISEIFVENLFSQIDTADIDNDVRDYARLLSENEGGTGVGWEGLGTPYAAGDFLVKGITEGKLDTVPLGIPPQWHGLVSDGGASPYYISLPIFPIILGLAGTSSPSTSFTDVAITFNAYADEVTIATPNFILPAGDYLVRFHIVKTEQSTGGGDGGIRLFNTTTASDLITAPQGPFLASLTPHQSYVSDWLRFTVNGTDQVKLQTQSAAGTGILVRPYVEIIRES